MGRKEKAINTTYISIFTNILFAVIKAVVGVFGHSYALVADAIESTTDVFASILVLFGLKYATRPPDENHPYGHGKAEPLITFAVVGFMIISATIIVVNSIKHMRMSHETPEVYTLYVLVGIILIKEILFRVILKRGKDVHSTALQADAWHHRSDALTSLVAFAGILIAILMGPGYESADDWAALAAAGFIYYNAFLIFRPALGEIMDEHLYDDMVTEIRTIAEQVDGVVGTEKCLVRKGGLTFHIDLHLLVEGSKSVREGHEIAHLVKDHLLEEFPEISDVLIHVEPG